MSLFQRLYCKNFCYRILIAHIMSDISAKKQKRQAISLDTKIQILNRLATGEGSTSVGKHFGLNEATVRTIKKNEAAIRKSVISGTNLSAKSSSYTRDVIKEKMEKALIIWIEDCSQKRIPVSGNIIKQKALVIYNHIKDTESDTSAQKKYDFSASTGWLTGFLQRHSLHNVKIKGEVASANEPAAKEFPPKLAKIIEDGGYSPDQVWNADETGIFWKKMPNRTYVAKAQKSAGGFKAAKDRVTLLFCSNASGDRMLKPLLVNRSLKPRSMKGVDISRLPVYWMANKKAWVTTHIFTEWFNKCFIPEVRCYMEDKNLEFKVLLILDNAPGHPVLEHPNVQICFLPPNTTSLIQPLDQGIIATFKTHYTKQSFQYILNKLESDKDLTVIDAWKKFSIMDCIKHTAVAISELRQSTLNACWKNIWPECVKSKEPVPPVTTEYENIIALAHTIGGEGFDDLSFAEIDELLVDKPLEEHEIIDVALAGEEVSAVSPSDDDEKIPLTASLIKKGLQLASELENHFLTHDPDVERSTQFKRDLSSCIARYQELYNGLTKTATQRLITEFFAQNNKSSEMPERLENIDDDGMSTDDSDLVVLHKRVQLLPESDSE